jgi:hypothetical protein
MAREILCDPPGARTSSLDSYYRASAADRKPIRRVLQAMIRRAMYGMMLKNQIAIL